MKTLIPPSEYGEALRRWQGGVAKIWLYHISHKRLALRLQCSGERDVLYIVGNGCEYIRGPFGWHDAALSMSNTADAETGENVCRVTDDGAGFELRCSAAALAYGPPNELDTSFESFLGDAPGE